VRRTHGTINTRANTRNVAATVVTQEKGGGLCRYAIALRIIWRVSPIMSTTLILDDDMVEDQLKGLIEGIVQVPKGEYTRLIMSSKSVS
jgi:hypothetical protein